MGKDSVYIDFIITELKVGNIERNKVLSKFVKKWQVSDRTFDRYWKKANEAFKETQERALSSSLDKYISQEEKRQEKALISRERLGEMIDEVLMKAYARATDDEAPFGAIETFLKGCERKAKFEGYDKPSKTAITDTEGKDKDGVVINIIKRYAENEK